jgi:NAD(P)-dependent dehydrogenase (short-subunit alcohol dehydrogenase family)
MPSALVTGSSRGIGRAIAEQFADDGYDVAVNYRNSEREAEEVVDSIEATGGTAIAVQADVSVPEEAASLVDEAAASLGGLDHVVNNAGINQHKHTPSLTPEEFDRMLTVNVNSAFAVSKAAVSHLSESTVEEGPSITNLSSILGFTGAAHECHYAASKSGVVGLTRSHASEFAPKVRVNAVAPGHIVTDMTSGLSPDEERQKREEIPLDRLGVPENVAHAVAYLCTDAAENITGQAIDITGGKTVH